MNNKDQAIGLNLISKRQEQFREIDFVQRVTQNEHTYFHRGYFIYNGGQVLCFIEEVFLNALLELGE